MADDTAPPPDQDHLTLSTRYDQFILLRPPNGRTSLESFIATLCVPVRIVESAHALQRFTDDHLAPKGITNVVRIVELLGAIYHRMKSRCFQLSTTNYFWLDDILQEIFQRRIVNPVMILTHLLTHCRLMAVSGPPRDVLENSHQVLESIILQHIIPIRLPHVCTTYYPIPQAMRSALSRVPGFQPEKEKHTFICLADAIERHLRYSVPVVVDNTDIFISRSDPVMKLLGHICMSSAHMRELAASFIGCQHHPQEYISHDLPAQLVDKIHQQCYKE